MKYIKLRAIIKNLPPNIAKCHKIHYLDNTIEIQKNELNGWNLGYTECLKNSNHFLIRTYLNL